MKYEFKEAVTEAFSHVLENLAFMFTEVAEDEGSTETPEKSLCARVSFRGVRSGCLTLTVPVDLSLEIAANIMGLETDDPDMDAQLPDVIKELANVTCGHILTAIAGEEPVFDLSIPTVEVVDGAFWEAARRSEGSFTVCVDGESPVLIDVVIRP